MRKAMTNARNQSLGQEPVPSPSPGELQRLCLEIQRGWTDRDRLRRSAVRPHGWSTPVIKSADLAPEGGRHWYFSWE